MPAAIEPVIKKQVIAQYLHGDSRDRIAADNSIGTGTVSNILDEWKRAVQGSDYESLREVAIHCKKEGVNLGDLVASIRIKNYITQIGVDEGRVEKFIVRSANSQDPQKIIDVVEKVGHIDISLEELEEHIKQKQAEKETLLHEINEARAIIDSVNIDKQTIEDFKELKVEMGKYHLEESKKFLNVLRNLKKYKYDDKRIVAEFSTIGSMKKLKQEIVNNRRELEDRVKKCKDMLPLAEQLIQFRIGIGEVLAFHSAVHEKADMEKDSI